MPVACWSSCHSSLQQQTLSSQILYRLSTNLIVYLTHVMGEDNGFAAIQVCAVPVRELTLLMKWQVDMAIKALFLLVAGSRFWAAGSTAAPCGLGWALPVCVPAGRTRQPAGLLASWCCVECTTMLPSPCLNAQPCCPPPA